MSVRRNTLINLVGSIVPMAVMLATVPLFLGVLGEARYGVLALVWLVLGYFSVLEMGLGKATANQIAKAHDAPAEERAEIFWTALLINAAMGVIGALILWLAGEYLLTSVLKMPDGFRQEATKALPWMISTLPLALISSVLNGALEGRDKFMVVNVLQVVSNTVFQVVPLLVAYLLGPGLEYVIPAAVISRAAMNLPFFIACYRTVPFTLMPNFSPNRAKSLFSFGGWVALTGIVSPVMETIDRFLIGVVLGANAVAHYTIAYQLVTKIRILPASLLRALFPRFSSHSNQVEDLAITSFSALIAIMTPVVVMGELLVGPFLSLWVGGDVARHATPIAQIVLVGVWANSLAYIPLGMLQGRGLPGVVAKLQMAELVPFLFLLYLATKEWGVIGAATAWTIRVIVDSTLLLLIAGIAKKAIINTWIPLIFVSVGLVLAVVVTSPAWLLFCGLLLLLCIFSWITTTSVLKMLFVRFRSNENF